MEFRCLDDDLLAAPTPWEVSFDDEPTEASPVEGVVMDPEPEPSLMRHQAKELELELRHEIAVERAGVMKMLAEFSEERRQYFCGAEEEVVRLSLAIAERSHGTVRCGQAGIGFGSGPQWSGAARLC